MTESILYTLDVIQFRLFKQYRNYVIRDLWIANIFDNIRNSPRKICLSSGVLRISGVCEIFFQKIHGANRQKKNTPNQPVSLHFFVSKDSVDQMKLN